MGIFAVTREDGISVIEIKNPPDVFGVAYCTFSSLADAGIDVDLILQTTSVGHCGGIVFTVKDIEAAHSEEVLGSVFGDFPNTEIIVKHNAVKISISGVEMQGGVGVAAKVLKTLWREDIMIIGISTSEIKISLLIDESYASRAMKALLAEFELDAE